MSARPHVVYHLYDRAGTLLYVGLTCNVEQRFREHRQIHRWFSTVAHSRYDHFPDGHAAAAYETALIAAFRPLHNQRAWRQGFRGEGVTKPKRKTRYTVKEAAAFLSVSHQTVRAAIRRGELDTKPLGDSVTITIRSLERYAAERKNSGKPFKQKEVSE